MSEIITEATGLPEAAGAAAITATTETQAAPPPEPTQEEILTELEAAEKEGRPASFAPKKEDPVEPPPKGHEQKLKEKHSESYRPPEERKAGVAREAALTAKIGEMSRQLEQLQEALKVIPQTPENQMEQIKSELAAQSLEQRLNENIEEFRRAAKQDVEGKYGADPEFRERHDYYNPIIADLDSSGEFGRAVFGSPYRVDILDSLYKWLDQEGNLQKFVSAPKEARLNALNIFVSDLKYKPRIETPPASAPVAAPPAASQPSKPRIEPGKGLGGNGYNFSNQKDCLKYVIAMENKMRGGG
jgi:hypothetical protein